MSNQAELKTIEKVFDSKKRIDADKTCSVHNEKYSEVSFDVYKCKSCLAEKKNQDLVEIKRLKKLEKAKKSLVLPARLERYSFENYLPKTKNAKDVLEKCRKYVSSWPDVGGALLLGGVGTGKTHLAVAICKELRENGVICHITTVNKIIRSVRSCWGKNSEKTEEEVIRDFVDYELLVVDEIGSQYASDSERIIINEIINDRYEADNKTVLIGNVSVKEASEILGARVVERVKDNGIALVFDWKSYRQAAN